MNTPEDTSEWLLVSDVDDTLLGDDEALALLLEALSKQSSVSLCLNSSRPIASLDGSLQALSIDPCIFRVMIGAMGTEIRWSGRRELDADWTRRFASFDRTLVDELMAERGHEPHASEFQTPWKASFDVPRDAWDELRSVLERRGFRGLMVCSGDASVDLLPASAGKGEATLYVAARLGVPVERLVAAGDSANDVLLFEVAHHGILVGNARDELRRRVAGDTVYPARTLYASGVHEGLVHLGLLPKETFTAHAAHRRGATS